MTRDMLLESDTPPTQGSPRGPDGAKERSFPPPAEPGPSGEETLRVLLVEDVDSDAILIEREISKAKIRFELHRVETRDDFCEALREFRPDIILADYTLPQFSAIEALHLLQDQESNVPLLLVTGSHSEEVAVECMREGAEDYILKSGLRRLPSAVRNTLRKFEAEREKIRAENALRRSEEQYRLITENTRDLICLLDLDFHFLYASPSYHRELGHLGEFLQSRRFTDLLHTEDGTLLRDALDEALFFHEARTAELRLSDSAGVWRHFECSVSFIFNELSHPQRALIVARDTTDRKRAEKEIRKLAAFPRFNPNPVLEFASNGSLSYFNDAAVEMARHLKKSHPEAILPVNTASLVKMCLSTGEHIMRMIHVVSGRTLSLSFFPIVAHQVVHCYLEDTTDSLNLEAQLRQSQKMESVGQLAAGVAHDFNNLLTIIRGHAGLMLSERALSEELGESARQISLAADRAANLTRQLLLFSRKQVMQPQLVNLNEIVNNLKRMLQTLVGETVNVRYDLDANLPSIYADPGMMEQILVNLAANSRDAMPKGGELVVRADAVELDNAYVSKHPEGRPGYFVCLTVSDTGHGMDQATLGRIFEPFFTTKEVGKGTGLGLATVYGIAKQHQGWIEVMSHLGSGTSFSFYLPAVGNAQAVADTRKKDEAPGGSETILVVEDEPALRELVQEILEKKGYRVLTASTGVQAMKVWHEHRDSIDVLFTDMMMPEGVSGRDLAESLLAEKRNLKVIFSSGYSLDVISPDFTSRKGVHFLQKPYDPETLVQLLWDCLHR